MRRPPAKKVRTSGLGESSRAPQPEPPVATHAQAPVDSELPSNMSPESIIKHPMFAAPPIEGNLDCRVRPSYSELYFDQEAMRQQPELRDSYDLLQRYYLEHLMTHCEFFYPKVTLDFYQSMTTHGILSPTAIHFTINGCHGILEAKHIAETLHIPFKPVDPSAFGQWSLVSQRDMVHILSKGTSTYSILLRKELPLGMLLIDVVLRSNLFPL